MSELFVKFPEILLVDGTYNVNQLGLPLYCFMVEDGFGNGRNVFYAATAEEDSAHLQLIIQSFKVSNPAWSNVHVIVIDKVGSSDCGLYSLAFAYTLSSGKDPAKLEYSQVQFRENFLECLKKGDITPFPHNAVMKNPQKPSLRKFSVYCLCRLPNTGDSMVQCCECKEWFHFSCIGLDEDATLPEEWHCTVCTNI